MPCPRLTWLLPQPGAGVLPPLCGRIPAGFPLEAIEDNQRDELQSLLATPGRYALRVGDDSMLEAGICDGDVIIVQSRQTVRNGDIVVALIDNEQLLLKRLRRLDNGYLRLYCIDAVRDGTDYAAERVVVQGILVGQLRQFQ